MKRNYIYFSFFFITALFLDGIFFHGFTRNQFIYSGDQFFQFSYHEAFINSFFIRKLANLGMNNGWQFMAQFWDALYYLLIYSFHVPFIIAEKLLFFLVLFFSFLFAFLGFQKVRVLVNPKTSDIALLIITLWYCIYSYSF